MKRDLINIGVRKLRSQKQFFWNRDKFIEVLSDFELMWHGNLFSAIIAKHRIGLFSADRKSILSELYRASPKAREIENQKKRKMFRRRYRVGLSRMGSSKCIRTQEERLSSYLRRLLQIKRCSKVTCLLYSTQRRIYRFAWRDRCLLIAR